MKGKNYTSMIRKDKKLRKKEIYSSSWAVGHRATGKMGGSRGVSGGKERELILEGRDIVDEEEAEALPRWEVSVLFGNPVR